METVLITGGSGFLGSALAKKFVSLGHAVRVLDNESRGRQSRLAELGTQIEFREGDIRNSGVVESAVEGCSTVIHLAYINGTRFFYEKPYEVLQVGVVGMLNVLEACRIAGVSRLFLASTSEVYQSAAVIPTPEEVPLVVPDPLNPRYSYGAGKILSELLVANFDGSFLTDRIIFRPHNIYGPDMGNEHVIPMLINKIISAEFGGKTSIRLLGNGRQTRSFMYIDDFAAAFESVFSEANGTSIINIGTSKEVQIVELASEIQEILGTSLALEETPAPMGETHRRCPDVSYLRSMGFEPSVPLREGLLRTVEWYADQRYRKR